IKILIGVLNYPYQNSVDIGNCEINLDVCIQSFQDLIPALNGQTICDWFKPGKQLLPIIIAQAIQPQLQTITNHWKTDIQFLQQNGVQLSYLFVLLAYMFKFIHIDSYQHCWVIFSWNQFIKGPLPFYGLNYSAFELITERGKLLFKEPFKSVLLAFVSRYLYDIDLGPCAAILR